MFSNNKSFFAFDCSQKPLSFVSVNRVLDILLMCSQLQIAQMIVSAVKVFVVNFQSTLNWAVKCFPYNTVNTFSCVLAVTHEINLHVMFCIQTWFYHSMRCIARPSFAQLDRMCCGYTGAQKLSNLFKGSAVFKHLFSFGYFGGVNRFASGNTAHISKIANFVQAFKIQNWFPHFHSLTPFNVNRSIA